MFYFINSIVKPFLVRNGYSRICEVGVSYGETSDELLKLADIKLTIVDPCLDADLTQKYAPDQRVTVRRGLSLEVFPQLRETFDCILLDGDHNWYTVIHELKAIEAHKLLAPGGAVFFHDVGWPYARRDMYYQPEQVPADQRQPYRQSGIVQGRSELSDKGINGQRYNALTEGGPRNGVLTGIEDFAAQADEKYLLATSPLECGLGVLVNLRGWKSYSSWTWLWLRLQSLSFRQRFGHYAAKLRRNRSPIPS